MTVLHSVRRTRELERVAASPALGPETRDPDQADSPHDNLREPMQTSAQSPVQLPVARPAGADRISPPLTPPAAPAAVMPTFELPIIEPQRPTRVEQVPEGPSWVHEVELTGRRVIAYIQAGTVRLCSGDRESSSEEWTERLPTLACELAAPALANCVLDGIVCALGPDGLSSRARLEQALADGRESELVFFAFDMPFAGGQDVRGAPLIERKRILRDRLERLPENNRIRPCEHVLGAGAKVFDRACELGLEGVISKRVDSPYQGLRSPAWLGVKCARRLNLVIGGFTAPHGSRRHLGALLVGSYENGRLIYRGKVGSGFCEDSLAQLRPQLEQLQRDLPAFVDPPVGSQARGVSWVEPTLGVEVEYGELTDRGKLRHARFKGLRTGSSRIQARDSNPAELAAEPGALRQASGFAMLRLTDPERLLFPELGLSKRDLADYVQQAAEKMLPHVRHRVLDLVCCPAGVDGERTIERQPPLDAVVPEGLASHCVSDGAGEELDCVSVVDALGLLGLVQMNAVEVRVGGARIDKMDHPDRLLFDLDPDEGLEFARVVEAAVELRDRLAEYGLTSFVKTSGGTGLHLVVPVQRRRGYAPVARFCRILAERMIAAAPHRYASVGSDRRGKVVINHARNARQASMVAPYAVRATARALVSTPLSWDELTGHDHGARPEDFSLTRVTARLARLDCDPWPEFFELRQWITKASFRKIGINPDLRAAQPLGGRPY